MMKKTHYLLSMLVFAFTAMSCNGYSYIIKNDTDSIINYRFFQLGHNFLLGGKYIGSVRAWQTITVSVQDWCGDVVEFEAKTGPIIDKGIHLNLQNVSPLATCGNAKFTLRQAGTSATDADLLVDVEFTPAMGLDISKKTATFRSK